jgi:hypothetical protein
VRKNLYGGPAFRHLYLMRKRYPHLTLEFDQLAAELKQAGDHIEHDLCKHLSLGTNAEATDGSDQAGTSSLP